VISFAFILFVSVGSAGFSFTKQEKYDDAKKVLESLAEAIETFIENVSKAEDVATIAKGLDEFAETMKELVPKINEMTVKYPELKDETKHPEELKPLLGRIEKDFQEMMEAYGAKVRPNIEDPAVKAAVEKYEKVMSGMK
jgi:hypothetical protein